MGHQVLNSYRHIPGEITQLCKAEQEGVRASEGERERDSLRDHEEDKERTGHPRKEHQKESAMKGREGHQIMAH